MIHVTEAVFPLRYGNSDFDFYRDSTPELIRCLNDSSRDPQQALLPYSFLKMVEHFRALQRGDLEGASPMRQKTVMTFNEKP